MLLSSVTAFAQEAEPTGYDFCVDNIYYLITTAEGSDVNTVEVACGNQNKIQNSPQKVMQKDFMYPLTLRWEGNSYSGDVVVPESVTYENVEYKVTGIGLGAFVNSENLTSVSLPNTITYISDDAFMGCKSLTEFTVPEGVDYIHNYTFALCDNLSNVNLSNSVTWLSECVFVYTPSNDAPSLTLTGIDSLIGIGYASFYCSNIEEISLPECFESWLYAFRNSQLKKIKIPSKITGLDYSLSECSNLEEVDLPNNNFSLQDFHCEDLGNIRLIRERCPEPPVLDFNWAELVSTDCVLEVPAESIELYSEADNWKEFTTIRAIDETGVRTNLTESAATVTTRKGQVSLSGCEGAEVKICSIDGKVVWSTSGAAADQTVNLPQGIYIVRIGNRSYKVIVK